MSTESLYKAFTLDGACDRRWSSYGITTTFDSASSDMTLQFGGDWRSFITAEQVEEVSGDNWPLDAPADEGVKYSGTVTVLDSTRQKLSETDLHLVITEEKGDWMSLETPPSQPIITQSASEGMIVQISIGCVWSARNGGKRVMRLLKIVDGEFIVTDQLDAIGQETPGKIFGLSNSLLLFVHWGGRNAINHVSVRCNLNSCPYNVDDL